MTKGETPRSLVRSLEDQVAQLESQVIDFQSNPQNESYIVAFNIARATLSISNPSTKAFFSSRLSEALFFHPSCPPLAVLRNRNNPVQDDASSRERQHSTLSNPGPPINLKAIPSTAMDRMVKNYEEIHLPQYPIISGAWLDDILDRVLQEEGEDTESVLTYGIPFESKLTHFDYFVVFIVLAISSFTLTFRAELQARASSNSFCSSALKHLQLMADLDEIKKLQVSLLLAHYAHMNPERIDNWTCILNATRLVLDLGLHKRSIDILGSSETNLRRKLFWVTYGMERSLCGLLRLPLTYPEDSITTEVGSSIFQSLSLNSNTIQARISF